MIRNDLTSRLVEIIKQDYADGREFSASTFYWVAREMDRSTARVRDGMYRIFNTGLIVPSETKSRPRTWRIATQDEMDKAIAPAFSDEGLTGWRDVRPEMFTVPSLRGKITTHRMGL